MGGRPVKQFRDERKMRVWKRMAFVRGHRSMFRRVKLSGSVKGQWENGLRWQLDPVCTILWVVFAADPFVVVAFM